MGDIADVAAALVGLYWEIGSVAFGRPGIGDVRSNEIIQLFGSYMSWLSVRRKSIRVAFGRRSTAVMSTDYVTMTNREPSAAIASSLMSQKIALDVTHSDLLRSDSTVKVLLETMEQL